MQVMGTFTNQLADSRPWRSSIGPNWARSVYLGDLPLNKGGVEYKGHVVNFVVIEAA